MSRRGFFPTFAVALLAFCVAVAFGSFQAHAQKSNSSHAAAGGLVYLNPGMPPVMIHPTVEMSETARGEAKGGKGGNHGGKGGGGGSNSVNLYYHGGVGGVGVEAAPKIYLVLWGSQWNNNDPSGEEALLVNFFNSVGGSSWSNDNTQYCQGIASGTYFCNGAGAPAGNNIVFAGAWYDNTSAAPNRPSQSQLAAEAVKAAAFFGNTTATSNQYIQYVIATATGDNPQGFGTQYCAWHSYTTSSYGNVSYTNLPYITDAGASCGANFNGLGADAGITIVEGHEMSESITDQFPSGGWLDSSGYETGDKCAWISSGQGASADVTFGRTTFPVQSLWSNAFNNDAGGCVLSY